MFWNARLKEGQYLFPFFRLVLGVALFQAAFNAVPLCFSFLVFDAIPFIDGKISLGIGDVALTIIAFYFSQ
jgi:hypothetical protein